MGDFQTVESPALGVYRVARRETGPFDPIDWADVAANGKFFGRFDDPRGDLDHSRRFRIIYCASRRLGALGETLAGYRTPIGPSLDLDVVLDDEPIAESFIHATDPEDRTRGLVEAEWRLKRVLGHTILEPSLRFVDMGSARTLQQLRASFDLWMPDASAQDVDLSLVMGSSRKMTQHIARYIYEQTDEDGVPLFAGIRYISRLDQDWECWAIFADRIRDVPGMPGIPETIFPDDPDLLEVASIFRLTIETVEGYGQYYRP